jgi:hypothetical protein
MNDSPELIHFLNNATFSISTHFLKISRFIFAQLMPVPQNPDQKLMTTCRKSPYDKYLGYLWKSQIEWQYRLAAEASR